MGSRGYTLCSNNARSFVGTLSAYVDINVGSFRQQISMDVVGEALGEVQILMLDWNELTRSTNLRICFC